MNLVDELFAVARALGEAEIAYAVCGGIAVTIHGAPRTTKDIDVLVSRADLPRALEAVRTVGFDLPAHLMTFEHGTPRERHVQRVNKLHEGQHLILDLLIAEGILEEFLRRRIDVDLPEGRLSVVTKANLLDMKRVAGRPQDQADIGHLEALREA